MKKLKIKIENWLLRKVCNAVVIDDIIKYDIKSGRFYFRGKIIPTNELKNLKEEAKFIKETDLYKLIINTLNEEARMTMNERSENYDDMRSGKLLLYSTQLIQKIINKLNEN